MIYDIAIIGAGPAGLYAAKELSLAGKKTLLFEKNKLGGVSTHEGCIPAKTLLYSATMWNVAKDIEKFGMSLEGEINFNYGNMNIRIDSTLIFTIFIFSS